MLIWCAPYTVPETAPCSLLLDNTFLSHFQHSCHLRVLLNTLGWIACISPAVYCGRIWGSICYSSRKWSPRMTLSRDGINLIWWYPSKTGHAARPRYMNCPVPSLARSGFKLFILSTFLQAYLFPCSSSSNHIMIFSMCFTVNMQPPQLSIDIYKFR